MVIGDSYHNDDEYPNPPRPPHRSYTSRHPPQQPRYATRQNSGQRRPVNQYLYEPEPMNMSWDRHNLSQNQYKKPSHKTTWDGSPMDTRLDWPARSQSQSEYGRRASKQPWDGSPMDTRADWSLRPRNDPRSGPSKNPFAQFLNKDNNPDPSAGANLQARQQPGTSALERKVSPQAHANSMSPGCSNGCSNGHPRADTFPPPVPEPEHLDDSTAAAIADILMSVISDKASYRKLLQIDRSKAQRLVDISQAVLENPSLDAKPRRELVVSMQRFSKSTIVYPRSYRLEGVKKSPSECIGEGSFGAVYRGVYQRRNVCLKALKNDGRTKPEKLVKAFAREAILWRQLNHRNILPFYGICELDIGLCMVSPWMSQGNLRTYIKGPVSPQRRLLIARDVVEGLKYLHSYDIVHGDLKGENVLVDGVGRARIADFGLTSVDDPAIAYWSSQRKAASRGGTVAFMAPEIFNVDEDVDNKNTMASDMYSWGCVCYELYVGEAPYKGSDAKIMVQKMRNQLPKRPDNDNPAWKSHGLTEEMWTLMTKTWSTEPELRPNASEAVEELSGMIDDDPRPQEESEREPEARFISRWCRAPTGDDTAPSGMRQKFKIPTLEEVEELVRLP